MSIRETWLVAQRNRFYSSVKIHKNFSATLFTLTYTFILFSYCYRIFITFKAV